MKAVRKHTDNPWAILYIQRWLKSPFQRTDSTVVERSKGTPQVGVISPVLANLFLHYAFDVWMTKEQPDKPFARCANDGIAHCSSLEDAQALQETLKKRFAECGLELHPEKTCIIYCKDDNRREDYPKVSFDFLDYTFRPRKSKNWKGQCFVNFTRGGRSMALAKWATMKYKKLKRHRRRDVQWVDGMANKEPKLFVHLQMGIKPAAG